VSVRVRPHIAWLVVVRAHIDPPQLLAQAEGNPAPVRQVDAAEHGCSTDTLFSSSVCVVNSSGMPFHTAHSWFAIEPVVAAQIQSRSTGGEVGTMTRGLLSLTVCVAWGLPFFGGSRARGSETAGTSLV